MFYYGDFNSFIPKHLVVSFFEHKLIYQIE